MAERERRWLFTAAGLLVVGAAVLLALLGGEHTTAPATERKRATTGPTAPVVQGAGREGQRSDWPRHRAQTSGGRAASEDRTVRSRAAERELEGAEAAARAFLSALLGRESGEGGSRARHGIAHHATVDLARFLLAAEPRVPAATDGPAQTRLAGIEPIELSHGRAELAATLERDGARSGLLVTLVCREGRWRIAGVR